MGIADGGVVIVFDGATVGAAVEGAAVGVMVGLALGGSVEVSVNRQMPPFSTTAAMFRPLASLATPCQYSVGAGEACQVAPLSLLV